MSELSESRLQQERLTGIGGSDIASVMSEPPYGCARKLAFEKLEIARDYEDTERAGRMMQRGKRLEEVVAEQYTAETGRVARRTSLRRMPDQPWRLVHVDRLLTTVDDPPADVPAAFAERTAPLECKVPGEWMFKKIVNEGLPSSHILQTQWAMLVGNFGWCGVGVMWSDGWQLLSFDVTRSEELTRLLADAVDSYWKLLQGLRAAMAKGAPITELELPDRLEAGDDRCEHCPWRRTCWGDRIVEILAMVKAPKEDRKDLVKAPELAPIVDDYLEAKRIADEHEALVDQIGTQLREQIGERQSLLVGGHVVRFTMPKPSVSLDMDALRADMTPEQLADLFKRFGKARKQTRRLSIS